MKRFPIGTGFRIRIGSEEETWVVDLDPNPSNGTVSPDSPLGRSLLQANGGFRVPSGKKIEYEIISVKIGAAEYQFSHLHRLIRETSQLSDFEVKAIVPLSHLDVRDVEIALEWCDAKYLDKADVNLDDIGSEYFEEKYGQNWELGRVLSARAAEKAAMEFYRRYGCQVEDVSIKQIVPGGGSDWRDYDLIADGNPIDVKNSRRSRRNRNNYVEHCVPSFKRVRSNREVEIAGVLSPYLWPTSILNPENESFLDTSIVFMGTTTLRTIASLRREFSRPGFFQIQLDDPSKGTAYFLPPWIFDYPNFVYKSRDRVLDRIAQIPKPEYSSCKELGINPIPIWLSVGIDLIRGNSGQSLREWKRSFISEVLSWRTRYGLSLPFLFLTIMTHFLEMVSGPVARISDYRPGKYRELIYYRRNIYTNPLFIFDPLETVNALITALDTMWMAEHRLIRRFQIFRLQNLNILRGRLGEDDRQWKTLIAYCGGWISGKERCGENPLVLGKAQHCPECGKLVCPRCGFCSSRCSLCKERQATFARDVE